MATERFDAQIGADIKQFQRKIKQVDKEVREMASAVDLDIDLATREFFAEMEAVKKEIRGVDNKDIRMEIDLAYKEFQLQIARLYGMVETLDDYDIDVEVDANITEFRRKLMLAKAMAQGIEDETIHLDMDIKGFLKAAVKVEAQKRLLSAKGITIKLKADYADFQRNMGRVATQMRNWGEIFNTQFSGAFISLIPTLSPIISSLIGLIGNLGVMIGVIVGQMAILTSALAVLAVGYVGLAAVAIPTIKTLFDETAKLTAVQQQAKDAWTGFVDVFDELVKATEGDVLSAFTEGMNTASSILTKLTPLVTGVAEAFSNLMERLNVNIDTDPITRIFDAFNKYGPEIFTNMSAAIGNLVQGILSMISAFAPAAAQWSSSFEEMTLAFATWADNLASNEGFQNFILYIQENMPLISQIFGDLLLGIIAFFQGFSDLAADFIPRLAEIMGAFREWSESLDENQGFQRFVEYMRESAPEVIATLVSFVKALVNFGIAMAPIGSAVLEVVTSFLQWFNSMMQASDMFRTLVGLIPTLIGAFLLITAPIVAMVTIFGKVLPAAISIFKTAFSGIGGVISKLIPRLAPLIDDVARLGSVFLSVATKAAPWLARAIGLISGPVGWIITGIITLIQIGVALYKNWDTISAWASKTWSKISKTVGDAMGKVKDFIVNKWNEAKSFLQSIDLSAIGRDIIQGLINGIASKAGALLDKVSSMAKTVSNGFAKIMKIKSPSRVMMELGKWIPAGVAKGIEDNLNPIYKATKKMASATTLDFSAPLKATSKDLKQMVNLVKDAQKEISKEKKKMSNAEKFDVFENRLNESKKWNDISLQQERSYWLKVANEMKKNSAQQRKALANAAALKESILQEQFDREKYYLDQSVKYETLSLRDRIRAMQNFSKQYAADSKQRLAYDEMLYEEKKNLYTKMKGIADDYAKKMEGVYSDLAKNEQSLRDEWQKTYDDRVKTLANTWGLFDEVKLTDMIEYDDEGAIKKQIDLMANLRGQVNTLQDFMNNIFMLESRSVDEGLLAELREMGPKAQAEIEALTKMSADQLDEYQRLWRLKSQLAGKQATSELEGARLDMEAEIVKLRENAVKELEQMSIDMLREINEIVNGSTAEFNFLTMNLTQIGQAAMQGLIDGLKSKGSELSSTLQSLGNTISNSLGGVMSGAGFNSTGFNANFNGLTSVNANATTNFTPATPQVTLVVNNDVDMPAIQSYIQVENATNYNIKTLKGK